MASGYGGEPVTAPIQVQAEGDESSGKKSTRDWFELFLTSVNHELLVCKAFYLFFFSAFGSLFPLMAVYFKQIGMSAAQTGILMGIRPLVELISAPLWGAFADRWQKWKALLLGSLVACIAFNLGLGFVKPNPEQCIEQSAVNRSLFRLVDPYQEISSEHGGGARAQVKFSINRAEYAYGQTPLSVADDPSIENRNDFKDIDSFVRPRFSSVVILNSGLQQMFVVLLILVMFGEFFSAPAITLADCATLEALGDEKHRFGRQRLFGSLGWALAMFFMGLTLDGAISFGTAHPCQQQSINEKNYMVCFATFAVAMAIAFFIGTQFKLTSVPSTQMNDGYTVKPTIITEPASPEREKRPATGYDDGTGVEDLSGQYSSRTYKTYEAVERDMLVGSGDFYSEPQVFVNRSEARTFGLENYKLVFRLMATVHYGCFLAISFIMGLGVGFVFTFLFWHLQDLGGSPTLFGLASVVNHISELVAYFYSGRLLAKFGHIKVLYMGLFANVLRFFYVSWLPDPWWVLPFEFVQGLTHATVWATMCSYMASIVPEHLRSSAQGVLQGMYQGLGKGVGAILGGIFVNTAGSQAAFCAYAVLCLLALIICGVLDVLYKRRAGPRGGPDGQHNGAQPNAAQGQDMNLAPAPHG